MPARDRKILSVDGGGEAASEDIEFSTNCKLRIERRKKLLRQLFGEIYGHGSVGDLLMKGKWYVGIKWRALIGGVWSDVL